MADLVFSIKGNNEEFIKGAEQIRSSIRSITVELENANNENRGFAEVLKKTFDAIGGTEALKTFVSDVIRVRGEYQQLENSFGTLLQSKEKADALMSQMMRSAAETPFSLTELANGAKQLIGYGVASGEVNDTLLQLGNIASGIGAPLEQITSLYGNVMAQGSLYADDLNNFSASGVPMLQGLADMLGVNTQKVNEMVYAGKIGFPEVQKVIENLTNEGGQFYGSMDEQSKTIVGEINNLRDAWEMMLNGIGESQEGMIGGAISGITYLVENYKQIGKILLTLIEIYGVYKAACIANIVFTQSLATTQMELGIVMAKLKRAFITLTAAMNLNPWVLAATAIIGLGLAMWNLSERTTAAEKAQKKFNDEQERFNQQQENRKQKVESLIRIIQDETETESAKIKAYEELQKYSPALTDAYSREEIANLDLAEAQRITNEERDENNYNNIIANVQKYTDILNKARTEAEKLREEAKKERDPEKASTLDVLAYGHDRIANTANIELTQWKDVLAEHDRLKRKVEEENTPIEERITIAEGSLDKIREEFNKVDTLMTAERAKLEKNPLYIIPFQLQLNYDNLSAQVEEAESNVLKLKKQKGRDVTYQEELKAAKKDWLKFKEKYQNLLKNPNATSLEVNDAKDEMNSAETTYKSLGGITDNRYEEEAKRLREEQKRIEELRNKQKIDEKLAIEDLANRNAQAEIDAMNEGEEKKLAQMEFNHQKEIAELKRLKADYLQKKIDTEKAIFEANSKNEGKAFDKSTVSLNEEEENTFANILKQTVARQENDISVYYKDILSINKQAY